MEPSEQASSLLLTMGRNPSTLPTDIARLIKGRSWHELREEFAHLMAMPSLWTRSTFSSTAGFFSQEAIQAYIERQRKS